MRAPVLISALVGVFAAASAPAVVWRNDITGAQVLAFGNTASFVGVGQVNVSGGFGTGTYIGVGTGGSRWILTANHVIGNGQTGSFVLPNYGTYALSNTYRFPGTDVSISQLTGFTANIYAPTISTTGFVAGADFVSAGYGGACPENGVHYTYDNKRRGMQSRTVGTITGSGSTFPGPYVTDRFDAPTDPNVRPFEGFGAPGDSGSMVLTDAGIVGVLSYGDYESYGAFNYYSQITPAVATALYARTGISSVPEPATLAALGLGALAMLRRRRRSA